ncbi:hypothetical protein [Caulobacter sp. LARHSG274]
MMDEVFKTHKETTFGWVLAVQELVTAAKARRARRRAAAAARPAPTRKPMRYLAPR